MVEQLLRDVLEKPTSTEARLAYADAIGGLDRDRAEFIRVQVALAEIRRRPYDPPEWNQLLAREDALLAKHGEQWSRTIKPMAQRLQFRRGFVEEVALDAGEFLRVAADLYDRAPILHLELRGVKAVARELFASPHLARIRSLYLPSNELGDDEAELLARSPVLGQLRWLSLWGNQVGTRGLEAIAASDKLPELRYFDLDANPAPNPCPSVGGRESDGYVHDMDYPPINLELRKRFGARPWLTARVDYQSRWPPDRDGV